MIGANSHWFHDELQRRIVADQIEKSLDLGKGAAGDFADYRFACGLIAGLELALDFASEMKKELDAA